MLVLALVGCSDYKVTELEPGLSVAPAGVLFGDVPVGEAASAAVGVVNSGAARLELQEPLVSADSGGLTASLDLVSLAPGDSATLTLTWVPEAEGPAGGVVTVADGTGLVEDVTWSGNGVVGALSVSPDALAFGPLLGGESEQQVVALLNSGLAAVTVGGLDVEGDPGFSAAPLVGALPLRLEPGATAALAVEYTAPDIDPRAATLHIDSDDAANPRLDVALTANADAPNNRPVISLLSPADGDVLSEGQAYTLRAFALDTETPAQDLTVRFDSALQGLLGEVHPDAVGEALLDTTAVTLGDDVITATVTDAAGATGTDSAAINVTDCLELSWDRAETFDSTFDDSLFALNGDALVDTVSEELILTDSVTWAAGAIYLRAPILLERFRMGLRFRIELGTGADGLAVVAATGAAPEDLLGRTGEHLGVGQIAGVSGFVIEVDVHANASRVDPASDHIALVTLPDYQHVGTVAELTDLEDSVARELEVDFNLGVVEVTLDGVTVLSETVPDWVAFEGYLGVTSATGAMYNRHVLERWDVLTGCW